MFHVHQWSVQALSESLALRQLRPDVKFDFYDQGALKWVMEKEGYQEHVMYQPHSWWNSFGLAKEPYDTDAFMLHFAGVDCCGQPDSKGTVMGRWLDIVENKPQTYSVELEKTHLPGEVEKYWASLKKAKKTMKAVDKAAVSSRELETARSELWSSYTRHADNATQVSMAIEKLEGIMAQVGVEQEKEAELSQKPTEEALKEAETNKNAALKAEEEAQTKEEGESANMEEKPTDKEVASDKKDEKQAKMEDTSTRKEAVAAKEKAAQAGRKSAPAEKEPAPPAKNGR